MRVSLTLTFRIHLETPVHGRLLVGKGVEGNLFLAPMGQVGAGHVVPQPMAGDLGGAQEAAAAVLQRARGAGVCAAGRSGAGRRHSLARGKQGREERLRAAWWLKLARRS